MKKAILLVSTAVLLALTAAGCEDEVESLSTDSSAVDRVRAGDLTFTLQILNMQGEPQAQFEEGENFQFQFIIENKADSSVGLPVYWDFPVANEDFFSLFRKTRESGGKARIGKSFDIGPNFRDLAFAGIPANGRTIYTMPWIASQDSMYVMPTYTSHGSSAYEDALPRRYMAVDVPPRAVGPGEYFTGFTFQYNETDSVRMEVSFLVD